MALFLLVVLSYLAILSETTDIFSPTGDPGGVTIHPPLTGDMQRIVVTTGDTGSLSKHALVPREEDLETSFTLTQANEHEIGSFLTAITPLPIGPGVFYTEIGIVSSETTVKMDLFLTKMTTAPSDIGAVFVKIDTFPTEISIVPTEPGPFLTELSLFSTIATAVPTEFNSFPTEATVLTDLTVFTENSFNSIELSTVSSGVSYDYNVNDTVTTANFPMITTPSLTTSTHLQVDPEPPYFFCSDYSPQSCSRKCGEVSEVGCSCDELCLVYKSCCYDYEDVCKMEANLTRIKYHKLLNLESTCQNVLHQETSGSQVISSCPSNNSTDLLTKQQCENDDTSSFLRPVTSKTLKFHFKNIYCMLCNGGELSDALFWTNAVGFDNRRSMLYLYNDGHRFNDVIQFQRRFVPIVIKDVPLRNCFVDIISSCSKSSSQQLTKLCSGSKEDLVSLKEGETHRIFKNIHCLNCSLQDQHIDQSQCKRTQVFDLVGKKAPRFQFLIDWKTRTSFIVTHMSTLNWNEMECHVDSYGRLQQVCQMTKCRGNIILKNNTCNKENTVNCFLYIFQLYLNVTEPVNDMESVNRTLEIFKPKLSDTLYEAYSKSILILNLNYGVSNISMNSRFGQISARIWVKLYGLSSASFVNHGLNTEHFKYLNSSLEDVRLDFHLCSCPAIRSSYGVCEISSKGGCLIESVCVDFRGGDSVNASCHTESSMFVIFCMFLFNYLSGIPV